MSKELLYIKANGNYYSPQEPGEQRVNRLDMMPVCYIKKLLFGIWRVDLWDDNYADWNIGVSFTDNQKPNTRIYLYPSGIEEIRFKFDR